jgi:predicted nucleic acid-binding protein
MGNKLLMDANVMLDFLLARHESAVDIAKIVTQIENRDLKGYLTISIIQILGYWLTKEWGSKKAKMGLLTLLNHFDIIDGNKEVVVSSLSSSMSDIEDALQYYTGINHQLDAIISRDKEFKRSSLPILPVYTPKEFISKYISS